MMILSPEKMFTRPLQLYRGGELRVPKSTY